mgnify:CR=1 FL=1
MTYAMEIACDADGTEIILREEGKRFFGSYTPTVESGDLLRALEDAWHLLKRRAVPVGGRAP